MRLMMTETVELGGRTMVLVGLVGLVGLVRLLRHVLDVAGGRGCEAEEGGRGDDWQGWGKMVVVEFVVNGMHGDWTCTCPVVVRLREEAMDRR